MPFYTLPKQLKHFSVGHSTYGYYCVTFVIFLLLLIRLYKIMNSPFPRASARDEVNLSLLYSRHFQFDSQYDYWAPQEQLTDSLNVCKVWRFMPHYSNATIMGGDADLFPSHSSSVMNSA